MLMGDQVIARREETPAYLVALVLEGPIRRAPRGSALPSEPSL